MPEWVGTYGVSGGTRRELSAIGNPCLPIPYPLAHAVMVRIGVPENNPVPRNGRRPAHIHIVNGRASRARAGRRTPGHETAEPRPRGVVAVPISAYDDVPVARGQAPEECAEAVNAVPVNGA